MPAGRRLIPFLVLGVVGVLAAGALVLGALQAPAGADLQVHNAAQSTLGASSFSAQLSVAESSNTSPTVHASGHLEYIAPDTVRLTGVHGGSGPRSATLSGADARNYLTPLSDLALFSGFHQRGSVFTASLPMTAFVPADEAHLVRGSYRVAVSVAGQDLSALTSRVLLITPTGTSRETARYVFERIDGQSVTPSG